MSGAVSSITTESYKAKLFDCFLKQELDSHTKHFPPVQFRMLAGCCTVVVNFLCPACEWESGMSESVVMLRLSSLRSS